jgi:hypothetical protein
MRAKYMDHDTTQMALPPAQTDPIYETDTAALRRQRDSIANTPIGDPVQLPQNPTIRVDTTRRRTPPPSPTPGTNPQTSPANPPGNAPPPAPRPIGVPVPDTIPIG